jgi:hypothetical protein
VNVFLASNDHSSNSAILSSTMIRKLSPRFKEKQFFTIKDNSTNNTYSVCTNCLDFEYNDVTITDITNGGTCQ